MGRPDYWERNREGKVGMVNRPKHGPSVWDSLPIVHALLHVQVLLGDVGVGKSSLVLPFVKGQFVQFQPRKPSVLKITSNNLIKVPGGITRIHCRIDYRDFNHLRKKLVLCRFEVYVKALSVEEFAVRLAKHFTSLYQQEEQMRAHGEQMRAQDEEMRTYAGMVRDLVQAMQMSGLQISLPALHLVSPSTSEPPRLADTQ